VGRTSEVRAGHTLTRLRALCLAYPETSEASSWGHPNFKAGKKNGQGKWMSVWAGGALDWNAVTDLVDRSYRVVALKRMIEALAGERRTS